jgi:predicted dehydrogenase
VSTGVPTVAIIGAGDRGSRYSRLLTETGAAQVAAIAEPDKLRRNTLALRSGVPSEGLFANWRELLGGPRLADAVVVATLDDQHYAPTMAALAAGYHVLVEKPMATSEAECIEMVRAAERAGLILGVCHVLRYTPYSVAIRTAIADGLLGDLISVEHLEPVGWWHFAHSYVRGNWRREDESTFLLMAKSVHDIDWLADVVGKRPRRVSSFGSLSHFRPENAPDGAADRCLDCPVEPICPYSAPRLYMSFLGDPAPNPWPLSVVTADWTAAGVVEALRSGPYGRCVYHCDNDVVDHQVVNIEYEGGVTASFTVNAFTPHTFRKTRIFGSHGYLSGNGSVISTTDFRTGEESHVELAPSGGPGAADGHGGGDRGLITAFAAAIRSDEPDRYLTPARDSLASHQLTWAAERARRTSSVIELTPDRWGAEDGPEALH